MVHCLFEQSGTFKKEFIKEGFDAEDYDILNQFGETEHIVDLFKEIDNAYNYKPSIFDNISKTDLIMAFYPCTRFESRIMLAFRGEQTQLRGLSDIEKLEKSISLHEELHKLYVTIAKMFIVALRGGLQMIVENPHTQPHYLTSYFPIKPKVIDKDRQENGDYFKKPTQFWFVNREPSNNLFFEPLTEVPLFDIDHMNDKKLGVDRETARSMIHPQYARYFIKTFVLKEDGKI